MLEDCILYYINIILFLLQLCNIRKTRRDPEYVQKIKLFKKKAKMSLYNSENRIRSKPVFKKDIIPKLFS